MAKLAMRFRTFSLLLFLGVPQVFAQDRLPSMPRYDRYTNIGRQINGSVVRAQINPDWAADGKSFSYSWNDKKFIYDLAKHTISEVPKSELMTMPSPQPIQQPDRGRQFNASKSPKGDWTAVYRDRNLWLRDASGNEVAVTTDGSAEKRTKNGIASWVYGEELGVRNAMWWNPTGTKLAYYRFDESKVKDYFLAMEVTRVQNSLDVEPYPKAGTDNPEVALFVYDLASKQTVRVDTAFGDASLGHYVYSIDWSPDGNELTFHRTNRKQNIMEWCAADPSTGRSRVVYREEWLLSWTENTPSKRLLADKKRYVIATERNGYLNYSMLDFKTGKIQPITNNKFDAGTIIRIDEKTNVLWYMAGDGENPYKRQLHRVGLNGKGDKRLTDPAFSHFVNVSPDGKWFVDRIETLSTAPIVRLCDSNGKVKNVLAESDMTKFNSLGLKPVERITFKSADGEHTCFGDLQFPSDFDPTKKYPVIVSVYGGPESSGGQERFELPSAMTELGFIVASFDGRGTNGRGKAFRDEVYGKLGIVEMDDQAAGVRSLHARPYINKDRVGIYGTSYGGYSSLMCLLRFPDTFAAAVASSSVTDWLNYDTIYTERYMGLPWEGENKVGYDEGSAMKYASQLKGRLLLFYGTADNNVHPSNTYQLARALQRSGKRFDLMVGPDQGHSGVNLGYLLEYFVQHLVLE